MYKIEGVKMECWICCQSVNLLPGRKLKLLQGLAPTPSDAFEKICQLLQVSFSEYQSISRFGNGRVEETFSFCSSCLIGFIRDIVERKFIRCFAIRQQLGFQSILKLQEQLKAIEKKIDSKIGSIVDKIKETSNITLGNVTAINFRSKAILYGSARGISSENNVPCFLDTATARTSTATAPLLLTASSSMPPQEEQSSQQLSYLSSFNNQHQETVSCFSINSFSSLPGIKSDSKNVPSVPKDAHQSFENYNEDASAGDDFPEQSDSDNEDSDKREDNATLNTSASILRNVKQTGRTKANANNRKTKQERQPEYFSPVFTNDVGQMVFEGITITPSNTGYKCGKCGQTCGKGEDSISLRKVKIHIKGFHLGAYKCSMCEKNLTSHDILLQHISRTHAPPIPCPTCGKPVKEYQMKNHQFSHMNASEKKAAIRAGYKVEAKDSTKTPTLPCRICDRMFHKPSRLRKHELSHVDPKFRKDYKCQYCDKAYTTNVARANHILVAHETTNARKRLCKLCGKTVFHKEFKRHVKLHRNGDVNDTNQCRNCGKILPTRRGYLIHETVCIKAKAKSDDCEFQCDICSKRFRTLKVLRTHRKRTHKSHWKLNVPLHMADKISVEPPNEDPLDDLNNEGIQHVEGAIYSYQLYQLEKLSNGNGYKCLTCSKDFIDDGGSTLDLEEIVKTHVKSQHLGNFRCNLCSKRMRSLYEVQVHQRTDHKRLRNFECDICGRIVMTKSIKLHMWTHKSVWDIADAVNEGEPFPIAWKGLEAQEVLKGMGVEVNLKCVICDKDGFDKVEDLYNHRRDVHPDAPVLRFVQRKKNQKKRGRAVPEGPQDCPECGKTFMNWRRMRQHLRKFHVSKRKKYFRESGRTIKKLTSDNPGKFSGSKTRKVTEENKSKREETDSELEADEVDIKDEIMSISSECSDEEFQDFQDMAHDAQASLMTEDGEGRRMSLRDRSSLKRKISYKEDFNEDDEETDDDDMVDIKQSPGTSSEEYDNEDY